MFDSQSLYQIPEGVETRWASEENPAGARGAGGRSANGRKGAPSFTLGPGESHVLAEEKSGSGMIRRIWATLSRLDIDVLRGVKLEMYWDGAATPAVSVPLGDFFGMGLGRMATFQSALLSSPEGKSFNCFVPMPFRNGMRIVVHNQSQAKIDAFYYKVDYTVGDRHSTDTPWFHAHYRRENPTVMQRDYEILPKVCGKGRYLGCNLGINANRRLYTNSWWGEGEVKIYLDGDGDFPTLCGTGTEDYIGTGWGQGRFDHLYQGCTLADDKEMRYCFYRQHIPDPVYFRSDIRVTLQQIGAWGPEQIPYLSFYGGPIHSTSMENVDFAKYAGLEHYDLFERCDDWSSCAYFYLDSPVNSLPELEPAEKRMI